MKIAKPGAALWAAAALLLSAPFAQSEEPGNAETVLRKTGLFALGGIGVAGTMSEGERALRELLKESDVPTRLEKLVSEVSPAGQLYALLGLRIRDRVAYERALENCGRQTQKSTRRVAACCSRNVFAIS